MLEVMQFRYGPAHRRGRRSSSVFPGACCFPAAQPGLISPPCWSRVEAPRRTAMYRKVSTDVKRERFFVLSIVACLLLFGCWTAPARAASDDVLDIPMAKGSAWGISVRSLDGQGIDFGSNEEKLFLPASVTKLFTTAVALLRLGPGFTYTTNLYGDGPIENGVLKGNLFVRGSGDPTLCDTFHNGRPTRVFEEWADELLRRGIRRVAGDIVGDDTLFDGEYKPPGWGVEYSSFHYAPPVSALSFGGNVVEITVSPGESAGSAAMIQVNPQAEYPRVVEKVITSGLGKKGSVTVSRTSEGLIRVSGRIASGAVPHRVRVTVEDPPLFTAAVMKRVFEGKGIQIGGKPLAGSPKKVEYGAMSLLASYTSPPLSDIIFFVNKRSDNLSAELIFRTLGTIDGGTGSLAQSSDVVRKALADRGIESSSLSIRDGSGLSRLNLASPSQVVGLLAYMRSHETFPYFYNSLSIAGVDGTLRNRMKKTAAEGRVHAKTGYLANVVTLGGYVEGRRGGLVAFSIMTNNYQGPPSGVKGLHDYVCEKLAE